MWLNTYEQIQSHVKMAIRFGPQKGEEGHG